LCDELSVKVEIPKIALVCGNKLQRILTLILKPLYTPLSRTGQIIPVREIKSITQVILYIFDDVLGDIINKEIGLIVKCYNLLYLP